MEKENTYQENIVSKICKRVIKNHNLSQAQQQMEATDTQEEEIRTSISIPWFWMSSITN